MELSDRGPRPLTLPKSLRAWMISLLKIAAGIGMIWYVYSSMDLDLATVIRRLHTSLPQWVFGALIWFQVSIFFSVYRLQLLFRTRVPAMRFVDNYRLYYVGMFLNFFLPGGVGGDAYKAIWIAKKQGAKVKAMAALLIADRVYGLAAIGILLGLFWMIMCSRGLPLGAELLRMVWLLPLLLIPLGMVILWYALRTLLPVSGGIFCRALICSILVQLSQCLCVVCVLLSFGVDAGYMQYAFLFLVSSIVTVIPVTIGGIGLRELCFADPRVVEWFGVNNEMGVTMATFFFVITAVSSLVGILPIIFHSSGPKILVGAEDQNMGDDE